jgi:hypothetical protein
MLGDGTLDAKPVLNTIASKGYIPIVKRGYGARIRDRSCDEALYAYRSVGARDIRSTNSRVRRQAEDEEEGDNKDKNTPKNHNKDPSEVDL